MNEQAQERLEIIMKQMQENEAVTEALKAKDQWKWVRRINSIRNRAEEIVLDELIYRWFISLSKMKKYYDFESV